MEKGPVLNGQVCHKPLFSYILKNTIVFFRRWNVKIKILALIVFMGMPYTYAIPLDWKGVFLIDATRINSYSKGLESEPKPGSQVIPPVGSNAQTAHFQTYLLKLQPTLIVNDSATIFAEMTTGYANGGYWGQGLEQTYDNNRTMSNTLYNYHNYRESLHLSQIYAKYYSNTATYVIGRQPLHWGLGALFNDGRLAGSRFSSVEDGITAHLNIGNFKISPYYMKANDPTLNGQGDLRHTGIQALYQNNDQGFSLGLIYGKRRNKFDSTLIKNLGPSEIKIIDLYFQKDIEKLTIEAEVPILRGNLDSWEWRE